MRAVIMVAALALAGCKSQEVREAEQAERAVILTRADLQAQCNAMRRTRDAWLNAGNQEKYDHWKLAHLRYCEAVGL